MMTKIYLLVEGSYHQFEVGPNFGSIDVLIARRHFVYARNEKLAKKVWLALYDYRPTCYTRYKLSDIRARRL